MHQRRSQRIQVANIEASKIGAMKSVSGNYAKLETELLEDLERLGNFHPDDSQYYFRESPDSKACAKTFLTMVINEPAVRNTIIESLTLKQQNTAQDGEKVTPNCISFITATLNGRPICFVALSGKSQGEYDKSSLMVQLDELAKLLNRGRLGRQDKYHYAVIMESNIHFKNHMFRHTRSVRDCAEYDYGAALVKLYEKFGAAFAVEGIVNCAFFPYENKMEVSYQKGYKGALTTQVKNKSVSSDVVYKIKSGNKLVIANLGSNYEVLLMPCCTTCQNNRDVFMCTLMDAQKRGIKSMRKDSQSKLEQSRDLDDNDNSLLVKPSSTVTPDLAECRNQTTSLYAFFNPGVRQQATEKRKQTAKKAASNQREKEVEEIFTIEFDISSTVIDSKESSAPRKIVKKKTDSRHSSTRQSDKMKTQSNESDVTLRRRKRKNTNATTNTSSDETNKENIKEHRMDKKDRPVKTSGPIKPVIMTKTSVSENDTTDESELSTDSESCCSTLSTFCMSIFSGWCRQSDDDDKTLTTSGMNKKTR